MIYIIEQTHPASWTCWEEISRENQNFVCLREVCT